MANWLELPKITNTEELIGVSGAVSASKGWHDKPLIASEAFALIHSEISEALEAYRTDYRTDIPNKGTSRHWWEGPPRNPGSKPVGFMSELADVVIRIADFFNRKGWDDFSDVTYSIVNHGYIASQLNNLHDMVSSASRAYSDLGLDSREEITRTHLSSAASECFHFAESLGCDLMDVINEKTAYNKTRAFKHGGKVI